MIDQWDDTEQLLRRWAEEDLCEDDAVRPVLVAYAGASPRLLAFLRPFEKGAYAQPLIELFALAAPLDADRLMFSISGRVWSLRDPIPPVTADADLRQQVCMIHVVDGADDPLRSYCALYPYEPGIDAPHWGERLVLEGGAGWIPEAMVATVEGRDELRAPLEVIAQQAARVARLGHGLFLAEDVYLMLAPFVGELA